jgi:hypothetical protein
MSPMNLLDDFDGSMDRAAWIDQKSRQRMGAFFEEIEAQTFNAQEIEALEIEESDRHKRDYLQYLKRPLWTKEIRPRILERDKHVCRCCGGAATQVHHRSYAPAVMRGENDDELASLCDGCHNYIGFDESGKKRTLQEANRLLLAGRPDVDYPDPKVDLRSTSPRWPKEWDRMSAIQRKGWDKAYDRLLERRLSAKANLTPLDRARLEILRGSLRGPEPD